MQQRTKSGSQTGRRLHPAVLVVILLVVLALGVLVFMRLRGWSGQRVEGQLTALVNPWNSVDASGYKPSLTSVEGVQVDQSCAQPLQNLLGACRAAGCSPKLGAGYISRSDLETKKVSAAEDAEAGFSEHEIGLAVDILDDKSTDPEASAVSAWLRENAWQYGFILRYPAGSEESTGMSESPWHYRYVGEAAAAQIQHLSITLEVYVNLFYNDSAAVVFER